MSLSSLVSDLATRIGQEIKTVRGEVTSGLAGKAGTTHAHAAVDVASGTLAIGRVPTGTTSTTVPLGNDARFSDARTPTVHAASHASGGSDPVAPAAIGAAPLDNPTFTTRITTPTLSHRGVTGSALVDSWSTAGDTNDRFSIFTDGYCRWGPGNAAGDAWLYRDAAGSLRTNAKLRVDGRLDPVSMPLVPNPPVTLAYAASLTPVATDGNYRVVTATGDLTLNAPTAPADGQMLRLRFIASGASRTVTLAAALKLTTGLTAALVIPSGKRGDVGLLYEAADSAWTVLAASAQL